MSEETVKYRATSAWTDPIVIINIISLALLNTDVRAIIPVKWLPAVGAILAVFNIIMQIIPRLADRPVRMNIVPGDSKPVTLTKLA